MSKTKMYAKRKRNGRKPTQIRHTHRTAAGIEDALAVLLDIEIDMDVLSLRLRKITNILREVRAGPHAYDPEKPAGLRVQIHRR